MGDISEIRGLVVIGSTIGVLVLLLSLIPSQFLVPAYTGRTVETPSDFEGVELEKYATTWNYTLDGSDITDENPVQYVKRQDIGGYTFYFYYAKPNQTINGIFWVGHADYWWIFETGLHRMDIENNGLDRGTSLDRSEIDDDYNTLDDITYIFDCDHTSFDLMFAFNETAYSTPSQAFDAQALRFLIGMTWDRVNTSMSAWDIIGMLLFFQLPDVHWFINAIIAFPIWLCIAYLSYILILRTVGAIFGGGA